jgi:thiol-disulfide isomerase/thioredoxin
MHRLLKQAMKNMNENSDVPTNNEKKIVMPTKTPELVVCKIYAEWCGHCKTLKPKWKIIQKKLAMRYPDVQKVFVYKVEESNMDNSENGLDQLTPYLAHGSEKVELNGGYPTIFKIKNGKVSYFEGPREIEHIMDWALEGMQKSKNAIARTRRRGSKRSNRRKTHNKKSRRNGK